MISFWLLHCVLIKPKFFPHFFISILGCRHGEDQNPSQVPYLSGYHLSVHCFEKHKLVEIPWQESEICLQYNATILVRPKSRKFILYRLSWCQKSFWNKYFLNLSWILELELFNLKCLLPCVGMSMYWSDSWIELRAGSSVLMWRNAHQTPAVNSILN